MLVGMKIDPATCKPDETWVVRLLDGTECVGFRGDPESHLSWFATEEYEWTTDKDVTPLYQLVPELSDADTLRKAATVMADLGWVSTGIELKKEADYLDSLAAKNESWNRLLASIRGEIGLCSPEVEISDYAVECIAARLRRDGFLDSEMES